MRDPKHHIKQRKHRHKQTYKKSGWDGQVSLQLMPIYPAHNQYLWRRKPKRLEVGEGYWIEEGYSRLDGALFFSLYHRHENGKSVVRSINVSSQCATCKERVPDWVKGAINLIEWSMDDEKAQDVE